MPQTSDRDRVTVTLGAVVVAVAPDGPLVLTLRDGRAGLRGLPAGPLEASHRTLDAGLRAWVEARTHQSLGHVEQLYTFGDLDRGDPRGRAGGRALSIGYLALVREARAPGAAGAAWQGWYRHFPWEDWRDGRPPVLDAIDAGLGRWIAAASGEPEMRRRRDRVQSTFGGEAGAWAGAWIEERVLERYELLYEAGLVAEAARGPSDLLPPSEPMAADHRRILATGIGRLRGKIKYRPLVFELMPPSFTFLRLQRTVEALAGIRLHKPNFRRLVEQQRLVEETGEVTPETGGRPARLWRFRPEVTLERPAPGMKLPRSRSAGRRASGT